MADDDPTHFKTLDANMAEITRLLQIHRRTAGAGPGYKHRVEVLNKSAVVLLVACWEAFVEDLACTAFEALLSNATQPTIFPARVRVAASRDLRNHKDEERVWRLAADGWKAVLTSHKDSIVKRFLGNFNTPRADQVDSLFEGLVGYRQLSSQWHWKRMGAANARGNLDRLVTLRGEIAHRVAASKPVRKSDVRQNRRLVMNLAVISSNRVRTFVEDRIGAEPWPRYHYRDTS